MNVLTEFKTELNNKTSGKAGDWKALRKTAEVHGTSLSTL
jgi:hypothetical protein